MSCSPDATCSCEKHSHSKYGPVQDDERLVRILTNKHYKADFSLRPTAFSLKDIISEGVSLIRVDKIRMSEVQEVADDIRRVSGADIVAGALTAKASLLRAGLRHDGSRELCVIDDPVLNQPNIRDNEAHCIAVSSVEIDDLDAKEIRDKLLTVFREAKYFNEIWDDSSPSGAVVVTQK